MVNVNDAENTSRTILYESYLIQGTSIRQFDLHNEKYKEQIEVFGAACSAVMNVYFFYHNIFMPALKAKKNCSGYAEENLEKLIPFLEKKATHALVLFEESTALVTDYMRQVIAKRQADGLEK